MKLPHRVFLLVALAVFAAACSPGADPQGRGSTPAASASAGASDNPIAATNTADPSADPSPTGSGDVYSVPGGPCAGYVRYSGSTGQPGGTFIRAATTSQRQWGRECDRLDAGDQCNVGFNLSYTSTVGDEAYIEFQGWTDTGKEPFVMQTVGPVPPEGQGNKWPFAVTVPQAKEVLFRLVLRDASKAAVAVGDGYVYKVGCRPTFPPS